MNSATATIRFLIPEQPTPEAVKVWTERRAGTERQVIARTWRDDDWRRCGLCPKGKCNAAAGLCMVVFPTIAPLESCALRRRARGGDR